MCACRAGQGNSYWSSSRVAREAVEVLEYDGREGFGGRGGGGRVVAYLVRLVVEVEVDDDLATTAAKR